jgi:regulatory protein
MDLLARREHGAAELRRKLTATGYDAVLVDAVLAQLAAEGLQDDGRFVEAYVRSRAARGFGPLRIRLELQERGIGGDIAELFLGDDDQDWRELLDQARRKRFGAALPGDLRERARQTRFLQQRGFAPEAIHRLLAGRS